MRHMLVSLKRTLEEIVFDNYPDDPSTKDQTHMKRAKTSCPVIDFNEDMVLDIKKKGFLSNKKTNKSFLIC